MKKFIFAVLATGLSMSSIEAQETKNHSNKHQDSTYIKWEQDRKTARLSDLEEEKKRIQDVEKFKLKNTLDFIQKRLDKAEITQEEAKNLKEKAAEITAANIDQKLAIVENQIKLVERKEYYTYEHPRATALELGIGNALDDNGSFILGLNYDNNSKKTKYDKRTTSDVVFAGGISNTFSKNHGLSDTPYTILKSGFAEFGVAFRTRLFKEHNFYRVAYGLSYQMNTFTISNDRYFAIDGNQTNIQPFGQELKHQKLRLNNLVLPIHFEFGPSQKKEFYNKVRYNTINNWKVGIGGFVGVNTGAKQFFKYTDEGRKTETSERRDFNQSKFIYGTSAYIGYGPIALYAKYEFQPLFKNAEVKENVMSLGLRIDL